MTLLQNTTQKTTLADSQARQNMAGNLLAIESAQPELRSWLAEQHLQVEWVFARDRTLTALDEFGQWWSGCSLPKRAAQAMLAKLDLKGAVGCFLSPSHAAALRSALDKIRPEQAIVAVVPDMRDLSLILHCENFSQEIASHRLCFVAGPAWDVALQKLFDNNLGLAVPTQFIRTPDADGEQVDQLIATAQQVFSQITSERSSATQNLRQQIATTSTRRLCVVAPSNFRLWNDLGEAMLRVFDNQQDIERVHFDADDPLCSSPLALLKTAQSCSAVLTANTGRSDLPGLLPEALPWITWITTPRVPSGALAEMNDHLIVIDPILRDVALKSGWRPEKIHIASWPNNAHGAVVGPQENQKLSIIADTASLETPKDLADYSSHSLLWEAIRQELSNDPFALRDINQFLDQRLTRFGVGQESFPRGRFIEKLILPAYQQGIARALIQVKRPLRIWGRGWDALHDFAPHAAGAIASRDALSKALAGSYALIHVWPTNLVHPVEATGLPLIRPATRESLLRDARKVLDGNFSSKTELRAPLTAKLISHILDSTSRSSSTTIKR